jgi:hypothetical protein
VDAIEFGFDFFLHARLAGRNLDQVEQVRGGGGKLLPFVNPALDFAEVPHSLLCYVRIVPVISFPAADFEVFYFPPVVGEVKVAPRVLPAVP